MSQMEKPDQGFNINAAFSFLTQSVDQPVTSLNNPSSGSCSLELPIAPPNHLNID